MTPGIEAQQKATQPTPPAQPGNSSQVVKPASSESASKAPAQGSPDSIVKGNVILPLERRLPQSAAGDPGADSDLDFMTELPDID